jgi:hypothetical protein
MLKIKECFFNYDKDVTQFEYKHFYPLSDLHLNSQNQQTTFKPDLGDDFISKNIEYVIEV